VLNRPQQLRINSRQSCQGLSVQSIVFSAALGDQLHLLWIGHDHFMPVHHPPVSREGHLDVSRQLILALRHFEYMIVTSLKDFGGSFTTIGEAEKMSSDNQFTALGPANIGFQANSASIDVGADITGNQRGITGRCAGAVGDGVQGFGSGIFSGVAGFGGNTPAGTEPGTGVIGIGGTSADPIPSGGPGIRGIGGGGPNNTDPLRRAVGVYGQGGPAGPGVVGQSGPEFPAPGVEGFGTGNSFGMGGMGGVGPAPLGDGHGVFGLGGGTTGNGVVGNGAASRAITVSDNPVGVFGLGGPNADGVQGVGRGTGGAGVHGISQDADGNGIIGEANNGSNAYGVWAISGSGFAGFFDGAVQVNGSLTVTGAKSAVVPFSDGSHRRLYCMESPESWLEDFGVGQLVNGQAQVQLEAGFAAVVNSDSYHVFITEYEDHNALYVVNRTNTGFGVRAKTSNTAKGTFSYRIVAKRKDIEGLRLEKVRIPTAKLKPTKPQFTKLPLLIPERPQH
jgi:hypothetical protein